MVIDTAGGAGAVYAFIFSFIIGEMREIFNSEKFNETYQSDVNYENDYKANVISRNLKIKYILDLTYKGKDYLSDIYHENGQLKEPI